MHLQRKHPTHVVLGAILVCTHSSIRFGDAKRVRWGSLQLSAQGLHAAAYATKTTKAGQPFFCTWHGISGRNACTSWLLHWLAALASIPKDIFESDNGTAEPDFLFPHIDMQCLAVAFLAPASYARTLLSAQSNALSGQAALTAPEANTLTFEIHLSREDRLAQGHHRDSARLYSRNDTFASLRIQRSIALAVADGWRPQRSMARGGSAPPEPPFSVPHAYPPEHLPAADLLSGPWSIFTASRSPSPAQDSPVLLADSPAQEESVIDPEAEAVEEYARMHSSSESETDIAATHLDQGTHTYVCSGPWNSMHVPAAESLQNTHWHCPHSAPWQSASSAPVAVHTSAQHLS